MRSCKCFPHVSKMLILKDKRENSVSVKILNIMHINVQNNNYYAYLLYIYIYIYVLTLNKIDLLTYLGIVSKCDSFFSNEVGFIWLRPPTHPLQMKKWKTEYRCIINQTAPKNIGFRTMHSPYECHDKGSIYESLSFQNHRHLISSKCTYNSTSILYQ